MSERGLSLFKDAREEHEFGREKEVLVYAEVHLYDEYDF